MRETENDPLHGLIRQTLHNYRPDYNPQDWEMLRVKLRRRRQRGVFLFLFLFISVALGGWLVGINYFFYQPKIAATPAPSPLTDRYFPPKKIATNRLKKVKKKVILRDQKIAFTPNTTPAEATDIRLFFTAVEPLATQTIQTPPPEITKLLRHKSATLANEYEIIRQITTGYFGTDSTTYRVLTRNLDKWPNTVIVCDFTSSMYPYSTQLFTWFQHNGNPKNIKGMVFFTDCDSTGVATTQSKKAGKMFVINVPFSSAILPTLLAATRNTVQNEDLKENNVEALLFAQKTYPDCERFVLISDNGSGVKNRAAIKQITKPVHVIVCGSPADTTQPIEPDYAVIARQTNGSLHTLEDDLERPKSIPKNTWIRSGDYYYRYNARKGRFVVSSFSHRPRRFLGLFW
ncbi:MAG: hypothetical protein EAZ26_02865 [Runella slithyformis]|nr:MAG: hypothetical protein EAZ26_02865 [Runella slithyformis]